MKTPKSSDSEEVTPSKKILKQARLPFRTISDVSPKSDNPQSRKRKLSIPESEPVTKVIKIAKENNLEDLVVISDDDSKDASEVQNVGINPLVKLVDSAWKKKLQKTKPSKKRKGGNKKLNRSVESSEKTCVNKKSDDVECGEKMEVDVAEETEKGNASKALKVVENNTVEEKTNDKVAKSVVTPLERSKCTTVPQNGVEKVTTESVSLKEINESSIIKHKQQKGDLDKGAEACYENAEQSVHSPKELKKTKSKTEDKNLDCSHTSNCNESPTSDSSTPRRSNRKLSLTNSQEDVSMNDSTSTNLTPKQLQKKLESAKKKEDREKERLEREKKKQIEKEDREKQKREKDEQRKREREEKEEAKRKEREEKEEQRKKEKEEKEKQKELEKKMREEKEEQKRQEKEEKEELRRKEKEAKEEEKKKKQEVMEQEKLEQEHKKKKAAEVFVSFFVPKQKEKKDQSTIVNVSSNSMLSSFTIKSGMRLAPTTRVSLNENTRKCLDKSLKEQNLPEHSLYVKSLKGGLRKPLTDGKTWPLSDNGHDDADDDDDVMIVEDELPPADGAGEIITDFVTREKLRPKFLAFHDNRRPPYWGTWRKRSDVIKPRQPFRTDVKLLDYEVDSDEEWEEEQDGESIDGSAAGSDDEQDADEYEVDNEVFVPHGYLSDEEATMDEDDVLSLSPETQKARLKHLEDEFETEMKKPTEKLKPWFYGLSWETEDGGKPDKCADSVWNYFEKFSMIMQDPTPLLQPSNESEEPERKKPKKKKASEAERLSPKAEKKKKGKVDDKDGKKRRVDNKKSIQETLKNQPGINTFLTKLKSS